MFKKIVLAAALSLSALLANANVIINPATGLNTSIVWNTPVGTGLWLPLSSLGGSGNTAQITVAGFSSIDISIADGGIYGDAFAIQLDGFTLTPTSGNLGANTRGPTTTSSCRSAPIPSACSSPIPAAPAAAAQCSSRRCRPQRHQFLSQAPARFWAWACWASH
jgi:hypothetical protein